MRTTGYYLHRYETWPDNPYAPNEDGILIEEYPDVVGTPTPATFTLYSINGMIFVGTALWLASDLTARHSDTTQQTIGYWLKIGIVVFSMVWTYCLQKVETHAQHNRYSIQQSEECRCRTC